MRTITLFVVLWITTTSAYADVTLHRLFTDHMVLQRDMPVSVFGTAEPGEKIAVSFAGQSKSTTAGKDGRWTVQLDAVKASANSASMTVSGNNQCTVKDIVVGDVWICSGQSNMGFVMKWCKKTEDIKEANYPLIRQFHKPWPYIVSSYPLTEVKGVWTVCTPESVGEFTAVGFYFGRKLLRETGVPIGLIHVAWGGTRIEPWVSPEGLASVPELADAKTNLDKQIEEYLQKPTNGIGVDDVETRKALRNKTELPAPLKLNKYPISGLWPVGWHSIYNAKIYPLLQFGIKGAIWYQGEANGNEGDSYFHKQRALIVGWRKAWNQGEFPFYFVQLPTFQKPNDKPEGGDGWANLRMAQLKTLSVPRTGMAVAIDLADVGNPNNIHPHNKRDVGERLALWALAKDYGKKDLVYTGPLYKKMKVEGDKIRIYFDGVGSGLTVGTKKGFDPMVEDPQGKLRRFAIAGEDKKWVWAHAVIDGPTVVVSSPEVPQPAAVRYAFSMNPEGCNLFNKEGLPASPFRTDAW